MMDEEDQRALQYKLTDFAVYDKPSTESGGHLVPIFAESLLSTGKKIYLSGKVLRLDCQEGDEGLQVLDIGPITEWTNMTGMEGGQENIILNTRHGGKDLEFNLLKPCDEYLEGILEFPRPTDISGTRSFFSLVNQASYAFSIREVMQPFRDLLKKGSKFEWTDELQELFK